MEHSPSNIATIGITARVVRRLRHFAPLSEVEQYTIERTCTVKRFGSHEDLAKLGAPLPGVFAITDGFAARSRILPDGRRQILAYLIPGDLCDPRGRLLSRMDHSITALGPVEAAVFSDEAIQRLERYPGLTRAFALNALVEQSVTREWLVNIGHRSSLVRLGHLFCEIHARLEAVGLTDEQRLRRAAHSDRAGRHSGHLSSSCEPDVDGTQARRPRLVSCQAPRDPRLAGSS